MEGGLAALKLGKYVSKGLGNIIERLPIPKSMEGAAEEFPWIGGKIQYFVPDLSNIVRVIP